jgi:tetratricopeptide (TPR) repeat protein
MNLGRTLAGAVCIGMIAFMGPTFAERTNEIAEAARPIDEGVPEIAVYQLQKLSARLNGVDKIKATEKLAEALIAAQRPTEALPLLEDPVLRDSTRGKFLRAQAFAGLNRYDEALPLYREVAQSNDLQRAAAEFGTAEMLRALDRTDEAISTYRGLENDSRFGVPARLREAELFIAKQESGMARRLLDTTQTKVVSDKRQKRLLHARVELLNQRPERAIGRNGDCGALCHGRRPFAAEYAGGG